MSASLVGACIMMKAISVAEFGGPDVMKVAEIARPEPKEGEVLIKVFAAGVNPVDTYKRAGTYAKHLLPPLPFTPGADGAGIVEALGAGVDSVAVGDRVWLSGSTTGGDEEGYDLEMRMGDSTIASIDFKQGGGIGTAYRTAYRSLFTRIPGGVKSGQVVLVHGASGGVGVAAIQLAKAQGCTVIGTAGTEEGLALVKSQGAQAVSHKAENYMNEEGVDVILEMAAHVNLGKDLPLLKRGGTVVVIGNKGMTETNINARALMLTESSIVGVLGVGSPEEVKQVLAGINAGIKAGSILPVAGPSFPLAEAPASHVEVIEHKLGTKGKIVLAIRDA